MAVHVAVMQQAALLEICHDLRVCVLHELPSEGVVPGDDALQVHGLHEVQSLLAAQSQVLVTEGWRNMDDARAVFHRDEVCGHHLGREVISALCGRQNAGIKPADSRTVLARGIQRRVPQANQLAPRQRPDDGMLLPYVVLHQGGGQSQSFNAVFALQLDDGILGFRINGKGRISGEGPRSGRPRQQERRYAG